MYEIETGHRTCERSEQAGTSETRGPRGAERARTRVSEANETRAQRGPALRAQRGPALRAAASIAGVRGASNYGRGSGARLRAPENFEYSVQNPAM